MRIPTQEKKRSRLTQGVMMKQSHAGCLKSLACVCRIQISQSKVKRFKYDIQSMGFAGGFLLSDLSMCEFVMWNAFGLMHNARVNADKWKVTHSLCFVSVHSGLRLPDLLPIWKQRECSVAAQQWN